jgi:hypothetical protein
VVILVVLGIALMIGVLSKVICMYRLASSPIDPAHSVVVVPKMISVKTTASQTNSWPAITPGYNPRQRAQEQFLGDGGDYDSRASDSIIIKRPEEQSGSSYGRAEPAI